MERKPKKIDVSRVAAKVLVVDDDVVQRMLLRTTLEEAGYEVNEAVDGLDALEKLAADVDFRLVLTDLAMPRMNGYELVRAIRDKELRYTYIIVLTSMDDRNSLLRALSLGADDYLTKPVFPGELKLRLETGCRLLRLESHEELIFSMAKLAEYRSEETGYHLERVTHYTRLLGRSLAVNNPEMGLNRGMADEIATISPLHDLGKVAIPDHILHKPAGLNDVEWEVMKTHTSIGGKLIKEIHARTGSLYLWLGYEVAMFHHERFDGGGYPTGIGGDDIPVAAKIMAVADMYDALTSKRCYKDAISHAEAKAIIIGEKGTHFDPRLVEAFVREEGMILEVKKNFQD